MSTDPVPATSHIAGRTIVITGAASGFGRLLAAAAAQRGANVVATDIATVALEEAVGEITQAGGAATAITSDVTVLDDVRSVVEQAVERYGAVDVMVNNAGTMPLGFLADHAQAADAWSRCIDINIKGVLNGMMAVYDQMMAQGRGHIVNLSSIYGNHPVAGAAVYGATKAAVNVMSEALRVEAQGTIKVTVVKPTGVPGTALGEGVVNPAAIVGILGQNTDAYLGQLAAYMTGTSPAEDLDPASPQYAVLAPEHIVAEIIHAIDQPWGVSIGDITIRATGDRYVI